MFQDYKTASLHSKYYCKKHMTLLEAATVHLGLTWLQQPAQLSHICFFLPSETILNMWEREEEREGKEN